MKDKAKELGINLLVSFASFALCFAAVEIALRFTIYNFKNYPVSRGPGSVYAIDTPEFKATVYINHLGLRGKEIEEKKEEEHRKLHETLENRQVPHVFMIVPAKAQVLGKDWMNKKKYDYRKPDRILSELCQGLSIPLIDLLNLYETLSPAVLRGFYYVQDEHWTEQAHHHAANVLADFIRSYRS